MLPPRRPSLPLLLPLRLRLPLLLLLLPLLLLPLPLPVRHPLLPPLCCCYYCGSATAAVCTVGRRARWRAPRRERKRSHSTPPSRDDGGVE